MPNPTDQQVLDRARDLFTSYGRDPDIRVSTLTADDYRLLEACVHVAWFEFRGVNTKEAP